MGTIVRKPPVSTKIAVAIDEESRWKSSERRLLEGEIAVSYVNRLDPSDHKQHKTGFQIRIGRKLPDGSLSTWKDAAPLFVGNLTPELRESIMQEILAAAGNIFVFKRQFDEAVAELTELSSQISGHVNANVVYETLYLLKNSELHLLPSA